MPKTPLRREGREGCEARRPRSLLPGRGGKGVFLLSCSLLSLLLITPLITPCMHRRAKSTPIKAVKSGHVGQGYYGVKDIRFEVSNSMSCLSSYTDKFIGARCCPPGSVLLQLTNQNGKASSFQLSCRITLAPHYIAVTIIL